MIKFFEKEKEREYKIYAVLTAIATNGIVLEFGEKERKCINFAVLSATRIFIDKEKERDNFEHGTTVPVPILVPIVVAIVLNFVCGYVCEGERERDIIGYGTTVPVAVSRDIVLNFVYGCGFEGDEGLFDNCFDLGATTAVAQQLERIEFGARIRAVLRTIIGLFGGIKSRGKKCRKQRRLHIERRSLFVVVSCRCCCNMLLFFFILAQKHNNTIKYFFYKSTIQLNIYTTTVVNRATIETIAANPRLFLVLSLVLSLNSIKKLNIFLHNKQHNYVIILQSIVQREK